MDVVARCGGKKDGSTGEILRLAQRPAECAPGSAGRVGYYAALGVVGIHIAGAIALTLMLRCHSLAKPCELATRLWLPRTKHEIPPWN